MLFEIENFLTQNNIERDYKYKDSIKYTFDNADLLLYRYNNSNVIFCKNATVDDEILSEILIKTNNQYVLCNRYNFNEIVDIDSVLNAKTMGVTSNCNKRGCYLLLNSLNYNYFHYIVDTIMITYFYYNYISTVLNCSVTLLVPTKRYSEYIEKSTIFSSLLKIDLKIEIIDKNCVYENVYYGLNVHNVDFPKNIEFQNCIRSVFYSLKAEKIIPSRKYLYISKNVVDNNNNDSLVSINNEKHRQITNENDFIKFLKIHNFDVIELSSKNYQEKCNIMNNYDIIITHSGASALNCFFNKGNGKILILEDEYIHFAGRNVLFKKDNIERLINFVKLDCELNSQNINIGTRKFVDMKKLQENILTIINSK